MFFAQIFGDRSDYSWLERNGVKEGIDFVLVTSSVVDDGENPFGYSAVNLTPRFASGGYVDEDIVTTKKPCGWVIRWLDVRWNL